MVVQVDSGLANGTKILNDTYGIVSDQNPSTAGNSVATTVQGTIALTLSKSDAPDPVAQGGTLTYVLTIGNTGNVPSTNIVVNEHLWSPLSTRGYRYKDAAGAADGIQRILVKGSTQSKSKALAKGRGAGLLDIALPIETSDLPLVVQLRNNETGICLEGSFATPRRNQANQFNAKTP